MKNKEYYEELACISAYIVRQDLLYGTFFQTFDEAYKIAKEFLELYPIDEYSTWGWGDNPEWDEAVERFVNDRYINGKRIK